MVRLRSVQAIAALLIVFMGTAWMHIPALLALALALAAYVLAEIVRVRWIR